MATSLVSILKAVTAVLLACQWLQSSSAQKFSFYKLAIQWPNSYCNTGQLTCINPIPQRFTIHGLWPQSANGFSVPPYSQNPQCVNAGVIPTPRSAITAQLLNPIINNLNTEWPDLNQRGSNIGFWGYEWEEHGMCSTLPTDPLQYFRDALSNTPDLLSVFTSRGHPPGQSYPVNAFTGDMINFNGNAPDIVCNRDSSNYPQLLEVHICMDRFYIIIPCPGLYSGCPATGNINFP